MLNYLRVKVLSLAAEAKIIRKEERRRLNAGRSAAFAFRLHLDSGDPEATKYQKYADFHYANLFGLREHRKNDVRKEARTANIAYGFLLGHNYSDIERPRKGSNQPFTAPNWDKIRKLVATYGEGEKNDVGYDRTKLLARFEEWKKQAEI